MLSLRASSDEIRDLADRISQAVRTAGGGASVSRASGTPARTLSKYMAGDAVPSAIALARIAQATDHPMDWFLGAGADVALSGHHEHADVQPNQARIVQIPILDVSAGAGAGIDNGDAEIVAHLPFPVGFLQKLWIKPEKVRAVRAHGDSMEPTIPNGMLVLINTAASDLQDGRIYALRAPDGLRLKRIQRQIDGSVTLISDNRDKYLPETLSPEEAMSVEVAGHAFWTERLI